MEKEVLLKEFDLSSWNELTETERKQHTLFDCLSCKSLPPLTETVKLSNFSIVSSPDSTSFSSASTTQSSTVFTTSSPEPAVKSTCSTPLAISNNVNILNNTPSLSSPLSSLNINVDIPILKRSQINVSIEKVVADTVLTKVNEQWNKIFPNPFTKTLTKLPEANVQQKVSRSDRAKNLRSLHHKVKSSLEKEMASRDTVTLFGTRQSNSQYTKQRMGLYFETKEDAIQRVEKREFIYFLFVNMLLSLTPNNTI